MGVIITLIKIFLVIWVLTMIVYFFNLDMKLTAALQPLFEKHYDRIKRDKHL